MLTLPVDQWVGVGSVPECANTVLMAKSFALSQYATNGCANGKEIPARVAFSAS